ncbi:MAG: hypothetical protein H0U71_08275 [Gammaproteobacteria bacterium]|nr:hypothetical protein [Gammaproteobacteria bacterium]
MEDKKISQSMDFVAEEKVLDNFLKARVQYIKDNKYPAILIADPTARFVMHFVPEKFQEIEFDIKKLAQPANYLPPFGEDKKTVIFDYNFDGLIFYSTIHEKHAYTQVFRDGRTETVFAIAQRTHDGRGNEFFPLRLQKRFTASLSNHLAVMNRLSLPGPYYLYLRFLSVENIRISVDDIAKSGYEGKARNKPLPLNELIFPRYKLDDAHVDVKKCLQPFFDTIWNAFGFQETPHLKKAKS